MAHILYEWNSNIVRLITMCQATWYNIPHRCPRSWYSGWPGRRCHSQGRWRCARGGTSPWQHSKFVSCRACGRQHKLNSTCLRTQHNFCNVWGLIDLAKPKPCLQFSSHTALLYSLPILTYLLNEMMTNNRPSSVDDDCLVQHAHTFHPKTLGSRWHYRSSSDCLSSALYSLNEHEGRMCDCHTVWQPLETQGQESLVLEVVSSWTNTRSAN